MPFRHYRFSFQKLPQHSDSGHFAYLIRLQEPVRLLQKFQSLLDRHELPYQVFGGEEDGQGETVLYDRPEEFAMLFGKRCTYESARAAEGAIDFTPPYFI